MAEEKVDKMSEEEFAKVTKAIDEETLIEVVGVKKFMQTVLNVIESDKLDEILKAYNHGEDPLFKNGFMAGMAMASMMTATCPKYVISNPENDENKAGNDNEN